MPRAERRPLLTLKIRTEPDIVIARQRARDLGKLLGLSTTDQVGLATAVSEIVRNAVAYAGGAKVDFGLELFSNPQFLGVSVTDQGRGMPSSSQTGFGGGLAAARRLTEQFEIRSAPDKGTVVSFGKTLPNALEISDIARLTAKLSQEPAPEPKELLREQNRDLMQTLDALRLRETELESRRHELNRLNLELEETNRGVVALYAELEERAAALRRADELKSQFLSYVSHEFRTPVNSVMALTHLLLRRTDGDLTSEQEKQVTYIRKAVEGLAEMVNDLLDLAKVESGKTEVRFSTVDASQILGAVRALMRPLATNENVSLIFEEVVPGTLIETDEAKVGQILRNLVSNALKFTEKGEVRVRVTNSSETGKIVFRVEDTGIGIAPQHLDVIFQEFSQIEHALQGRVKGTGLGLSLSRKLAELLGGGLEASSQPGKGSAFTLTLPKHRSTPSESDATTPEQQARTDALILIVEDDEASRYVCRRIFRGTPYRMIESDALEAAERARFERPDLIILDLMMPGRTGFEVLDELKSDPSTSPIPVVIHTSKAITPADLARLAGRHVGLLPKSGKDRKPALEAIREALGDQRLFEDEPEFEKQEGPGSE